MKSSDSCWGSCLQWPIFVCLCGLAKAQVTYDVANYKALAEPIRHIRFHPAPGLRYRTGRSTRSSRRSGCRRLSPARTSGTSGRVRREVGFRKWPVSARKVQPKTSPASIRPLEPQLRSRGRSRWVGAYLPYQIPAAGSVWQRKDGWNTNLVQSCFSKTDDLPRLVHNPGVDCL